VVAILKMATGRNFSMSGIILGHHNLPTYEMSLKSDNVEFVRYCGGHFENGDRYKFFDANFRLITGYAWLIQIPSTATPKKFNFIFYIFQGREDIFFEFVKMNLYCIL
jgi:hypothetical protein